MQKQPTQPFVDKHKTQSNMNLDEAREYLEFLLNGLRAFHPEVFELEAGPTDHWEGWRRDDFVPLVLNLTQAKTAPEAKAVLEGWLSTPEITRNVPLSIIEAAKETKEIAQAPTPEAQRQASEVLLAKSSNLAAELEAAGQVVPKPSAATPEALAPTRPPTAVVTPAPPVTPIEEGAVVLRPIRLAASPKAEVKSITKEATEKKAAFREQIKEWIKETFPQTPEEKAQALSERFTQRLVALEEEKPTVAATLKAVAKSDQVAPDVRKKAARLLNKAANLAEEDRKIIEKAVSEKIPREAVKQAFAQDAYEYESIARPVQKSVVVRAENFVEKAEASIAQKTGVDFAEAIIPTATAIPTVKAIEETLYIKPARRLPAGLDEKAQESLASHTNQARINAQKYIGELTEKISKTLPGPLVRATSPKEAAEISRRTAENFVERLLNPEKPSITDYTRPENEATLKKIFPDEVSRQEFLASANEALIAETAESQILANAVDKQVINALYGPAKLEASTFPQPGTFPTEAFSLQEAAYLKTEIARSTLPVYGLLLSEQGVVPAKIQAAKIIGVTITRATPKAKDWGERAAFSSFKFVRELGAEQFAKAQPHEATALKLISMGIGSKDIASLAEQAEKLGLRPTVVSLKNLEQALRAIEEAQPSLARFAQRMEVELKLIAESSQLRTSQFLLVPSQQSYLFAPSTPDQARSPIFSYFQRFLEKPASNFLGRLTAPAKEKIARIIGKKELARIVSKKGLKKLAGGLLAKIATKLGLKALFVKIGAILGTLIPIPLVGQAIGAVLGFLAGFALDALSWLKKQIQKNKEAFAGFALLAGGLLIGGPAGLAMIGGAIGLGAIAVGGTILAGLYGLTKIVLLAIGIPIIVAMIAVPTAIVLILFIINSGAYIVPHAPSLLTPGVTESPYIRVTKVARSTNSNKCTVTPAPEEGAPTLECENDDLPLTIEYTITVEARKGTLANISFEHECIVIRDSPVPSCSSSTPDSPLLISPVEPFEFTYTQTYGSGFTDSNVVDTFIVTADQVDEGVVGARAAASASIIIGDPPAECPRGWPVGREGGETPLPILQGPHTSGGSHNTIEAIDIFTERPWTDFLGHVIRATHTGIVSVCDTTASPCGNYGNFVDITSICTTVSGNPVSVTSRYSHLDTISVTTGQTVSMGAAVGTGGSSGTGSAHLHYEFRPPPGPIPMDPPYIPLAVPDGCNNFGGIPCMCGPVQCAVD